MKTRSVFTIVLLLSLALAGCNDDDDKQQPKQQQSAEVNRLNRDLQKAETNVSKQESAKAWWQNAAGFLAVAAIGLLVIGTIIGRGNPDGLRLRESLRSVAIMPARGVAFNSLPSSFHLYPETRSLLCGDYGFAVIRSHADSTPFAD